MYMYMYISIYIWVNSPKQTQKNNKLKVNITEKKLSKLNIFNPTPPPAKIIKCMRSDAVKYESDSALFLARLIKRWAMPAFKQWNLAMSIELSFPKACFWNPTTLQPWSVSSVRRALGSVRNCKTKHLHAPIFRGWSVTGCKADYQFCNAGFQPQGIRQVFSSLRGKCQSTKGFQKFTLSTPWGFHTESFASHLWIVWWPGYMWALA